MFVYNTIQFCVEAYTAQTYLQMEWWLTSTIWNITFSVISVNIVSVLRLQIMWFFLTRSNRLTYFQNIRPAICTSGLQFSGCCDPSPVLEQLMHEADHLSLFSAEVTDQCSCNCASAECLHGVHTDNFTFNHLFCRIDSNI